MGIQVLGVSRPGEVVSGPAGVNPAVVPPAAANPPRRVASSDLRNIVAPPLLSIVAGIKDLKDHAIADEAVSRDMVAVENALNEILARFDLPAPPRAEPGLNLSRREIQVLSEVATGLSDKQIARRLDISQKTVRNHLSHVFIKLQAGNRTEAVMNAMRGGLF